MDIYINDQQTSIELDNNILIDSALVKIEAWCSVEKVIITETLIDKEIYNKDKHHLLSINNIKTLEIKTKPQNIFLKEVTNEVIEYIPKLKKGIENSYTSFQSGNIDEGIAWFNQCINGIEWTNSVLSKLNLIFNRNPERLKEYDHLSDEFVKFNGFISEIFKAFKNEDYVSISDILEYNLIDCLNNFKKFILNIKNIKE